MEGLATRDLPLNFRSFSLLSAAVLLGVVLLAVHVASQTAVPSAPSSLTVMAKDGRRAVLTTTPLNDQEFVALDDLANTFQLAVHEESGAITVTYKGKTVIVTPEQALASVSGRLVSLPAAPVRAGRRWLVPVEFISRALAAVYDVRLDLRKASHLLIVGDLRVPRITVKYEPLGSAARLTVDASPRTTSTVLQEADRLTIKFDADALDAVNPLLGPQPATAIVQAVRVIDPLTVSVELGTRFAGFRASAEPVDSTMRLVIDLVSTQTGTDAPTAPAAPPPVPELPPAFTQPSSAVRVVAIDAGHGGSDEGTKGLGGAKEKDITLAVARRLKGAIEGRLGIRVLLTRDDDHHVPVDDRTALANNNKADVFISLHANGSLRTSASGATIFSATFPRDAEQQARASFAPERLPTFGGGLRNIELVPWDLAQYRHIDDSVAFAKIIQEQFRDHVPLSVRPTDQAPLRILESANMPAVLIEMGFLTNEEQEKALAGPEFQSVLVQAIFDSILRFRDRLAAGGTR
jgi:N-acetylmuramoyl-L-alanine amidase